MTRNQTTLPTTQVPTAEAPDALTSSPTHRDEIPTGIMAELNAAMTATPKKEHGQ
tara:strand:- start:942 stop:1106 length:165 start_codon:yes stop_codon:yes gene_type:complete